MSNKLLQTKLKRKKRVSFSIVGTSERPRVSVFRSNKNIFAQIIDDSKARTIVALNSATLKLKGKNKTEVSKIMGLEFGKMAVAKDVKKVVFDRGSSAYKGRVKALAEGMRESGLEF
jgi:large subunit ribosomal protein L18